MTEQRTPTLREHAVEHAARQFLAAMNGHRILDVELVAGRQLPAHVLRYGARALAPGRVRVGIVYDYPGVSGALYHGADLARHEAAHWFSTHGVPAVRVKG